MNIVSVARRGTAVLLALLCTGVAAASAQAQTRQVRGQVVHANTRAPLQGVSVSVRGTDRVTVTNEDGRYTIAVGEAVDALVFSSIGYAEQVVAIGGRSVIDIALVPTAIELDELVVVGYTTQRSRDVTGAVSRVSVEELEARKVSTLEDALKARIPGVEINSTGEPGEGAQVLVRGLNFIGDNSPLYVVDGLYMRQNPNLAPENIASIQVLKDASAAAQYGAQAANGVIVIQTKGGFAGETEVSLSSYFGYEEVPKLIDMMSADEWAAINRMAYENAGLAPMEGAVSPQANTDWQDAVIDPGAIQNHHLAVSGGGENANYRISGGYMKQSGAIIETGFERYNLRVNSEVRKGRLLLGERIALSRSTKENMVGFPLIDALRMLPSIPVYDSTTTSGFGFGSPENYTFGTNPVGLQKMEDNTTHSDQAIGTLFAELGLLDNLRYRFNLGFRYENYTNRVFNRMGQIRLNNPLLPARLSVNNDDFTSLLFENLVTFQDNFGDHGVSTVLGFTEQREEFNHLMAFRESFSDENLRVIDAGTDNLNNAGNKIVTTLRSFLGRTTYNYGGRYLLTASFRRDGSSRFGPDHRYGNFMSGSVGWVMSEEGFYESVPLLGDRVDYFKVRASHGKLGNQDIGDYQFAGLIEKNISYVLGSDAIANGAIQLNLANPGIRWQENTQTNFGVDLSMLDSRLTVNADYYISESGGLLVRAPLPPSVGSEESPYVNAGSVRNSGFELGANYAYTNGDFYLNTGLTLTTTDNEVLSLGNGGQPIFAGPFGVTLTEVGGPIGAFYVLKTDGLFQSAEEVTAHGAQAGAQPGDVRYVDKNGDGLINDEDRFVMGSPYPDIQGGLFLDGGYRNFDFGVSLRGSRGAEIFNVAKFWTGRLDDNSNYRAGLDPWTPQNTDTETPRAIFGPAGAMNANPVSDRWIEDGSYLRLQNVELGYTPSADLLSRVGLGVETLRLYVNLQNLHTFTGYSNWDPEVPGPDVLARGVDDARIYPNVRTISVGVDITM